MYRTIKIAWFPKSKRQWQIYSTVRKEAARLWNDLISIHKDARCNELEWPTYCDLCKVTKGGKYPNLNSRSVQQTVRDFYDCVRATIQARKKGLGKDYPKNECKYRDVIYIGNQIKIKNGYLSLFNGRNVSPLNIKLSKNFQLIGLVKEVQIKYGEIDQCHNWKEIRIVFLPTRRT